MKQIVIISHKTMAQGMADTINFFAGDIPNLHYICAYRNGKNNFPIKELTNLIATFEPQEQIFLLTDLLGGSVNQNCTQLIKNPRISVITGANLALALSIVLDPSDHLSAKKIAALVNEAKEQMIYMNDYASENEADDE